MAEERIQDGKQWQHKKMKYTVTIEQSARQGYTHFRRDVSVRKDGATPLRKVKTPSFLKQFEEAPLTQPVADE